MLLTDSIPFFDNITVSQHYGDEEKAQKAFSFFCVISPESSRMDGRFTCTDMRIFDGQRTASSMLRAGSISPESSRMDGIKNASASDAKAF